MDPSAPNFDSLRAQLIDDAVAFGTDNPANGALQVDLHGALADIHAGEPGATSPAGRVSVVVTCRILVVRFFPAFSVLVRFFVFLFLHERTRGRKLITNVVITSLHINIDKINTFFYATQI